MLSFIALFPELFAVWTGILIMWCISISIGLIQIMNSVYNIRKSIRNTDTIHLVIVLSSAISYSLCLFVFTEFTSYFLDLLLIINFWFTIYLSYITIADLRLWPNLSDDEIFQVRSPSKQFTVVSH